MKNISFALKEENPDYILSGLKTLPLNNITICRWLEEDWLPAEKYLDWAKKGLKENDDYGFSIAITYSKKCVCRRIDSLILYNHLYPFKNINYPEKLVTLDNLGIVSPKIIHDLVINIRNELEHLYQRPIKEKAENAIELAELYINATQTEFDNGSIVMVHSRNLYTHIFKNSDSSEIHFNGFSTHPMFAVDIFKDEVKIVYPKDREIRFSKIIKFSNNQSMELSQILRKHYQDQLGNKSRSVIAKGDLQVIFKKAKI